MMVLRFDSPILVFGGPYSNLEATRALLAEAAQRGIAPGNMICTGDVVAYCGDPSATANLVAASGCHVVMGNCEEQLAANAADCGCGFAEGSACDTASKTWFAYASAELGNAHRSWMGALPREFDIAIGGLTLRVVHATPSSLNRFVFASTPDRVKRIEIGDVDGLIGGHCGLPFTQTLGGKLWHNAGVIGMPANDGTPRGWFSILSPRAEGGVDIEHVAFDYDHASAAHRMRAARLPEAYADSLSTGLWPSCDVLPKDEVNMTGIALIPGSVSFARDRAANWPASSQPIRLDPAKFRDPAITAKGEKRASIALRELDTLWINTGTLCNLSCATCYIESTPKNDRLVYLSVAEAAFYFDEIERDGLPTRLIGFTGGEPFLNREFPAMLEDALSRGFEALVLTNAMKPMRNHAKRLLAIQMQHGDHLTMRVSLDHYTRELHELERGEKTFEPALDGLRWLNEHGFRLNVAGRMYSGETESIVRAGYAALFEGLGLALDAFDPVELVLFPEMDASIDMPEITTECWSILNKSPDDIMCSSSRMVVKRKGADKPAVLACTLLAYDEQFELGTTLKDAARDVALNHPHCAKFCVLGGAACSRA